LKDKKLWYLFLIIGVAAYFRLWHIQSLSNIMGDYDQGVYALFARFISQGQLPYRDFVLVAPPFYYLVLSSIYRIFGYSFYFGQYLSVCLSLASIVFIYLIGVKITKPVVGLIAAGLFAVSPDMIYYGRRETQEALGIFLIILAIYFIVDFIINKKRNRLIFSGLALGLVIATKYTFVPAVLAVFGAAIIFLMGKVFWEELRRLVKPLFLITYCALVALVVALLFVIVWVGKVSIPIPFLSVTYLSVSTLITDFIVFVFPLVLAFLISERKLHYKQWGVLFIGIFKHKEIWYLAAGILSSFLIVTGYFLIKTPYQFVNQTFLLQGARGNNLLFPSILPTIETLIGASTTAKLAYLPIFLALPVALIVLNKHLVSPAEIFVSFGIIIAMVFCQFMLPAPRYYVSLYPFFLLGLSFLIPQDANLVNVDIKSLSPQITSALISIVAVFFLFISAGCVLLVNYGEYDTGVVIPTPDARYVYQQTDNFLNSISAKKIYSVDPIFTALDPKLGSTTAVDTFSLLWLAKESPEQFIRDQIAQGVDYVVVDNTWINFPTNTNNQAAGLVSAMQSHGRLVGIVTPGLPIFTTIWALNVDKNSIFNGNFTQWAQEENSRVPLGWLPIFSFNSGNKGGIRQANVGDRPCVELYVSGTSSPDINSAESDSSLNQSITFPQNNLAYDVFPTVNTSLTQSTGIHFDSDDGHTLILGFSDEVTSEQVIKSEDGNTVLVLRPTDLNQWTQQTINLAQYWNHEGWTFPDNVNIKLVASSGNTNQTQSTFYVSEIGEQ